VEGLDALVNLTILHLRANNIGSLNKLSPRLVNLQYLNCRSAVAAWFHQGRIKGFIYRYVKNCQNWT